MLCGKGMKPSKNRHWIGGRREPGGEEDRRKLRKGPFFGGNRKMRQNMELS
jgi:hypothetical protein